MPAAGGGVKGKRSVCRGRQDASLLCQAKRLPGTANGEKELRNILSPSHGYRRDSHLRVARSAALTAHRAVIHYRRLRFAYPRQRGP